VLYEGVLAPGRKLAFRRRFVWVRLGAPANVRVRVAGKLVRGVSGGSPLNLLVTPRGPRVG
jgi:hypothetical protein